MSDDVGSLFGELGVVEFGRMLFEVGVGLSCC